MALPLRRYGERALLIDAGDAPLEVYAAVLASDLAGVSEVVPAAATVLVTFDDASHCSAAAATLASLTPQECSLPESETLTIPVRYDGPDLPEVAAATGLTAAEVIAAHTGSVWQVAFLGFAPGFAYLTGGDPALTVSRRADPRASVPAGSVALAGGFSAIYPNSSPGGWQLLGTALRSVWDIAADPPTPFVPGRRVQFEQVS